MKSLGRQQVQYLCRPMIGLIEGIQGVLWGPVFERTKKRS